MMISHHDHHRHSAYVLAHVDAPGFSQSQLRRIGDLVLGQRGGLRKLEARLQEVAFALHLFCLRLAVIVCHARGDVDPAEIALVGDSGQPTLAPALGWAETHPRALHLLREEIEAWSRIGVLQPALAPS
jgi:exopolyphosphatase/guanosine-5'-triphosphate,3'-diphosphate pyrophosphatase